MRRKIILFLLFCVVITLHAPPALADLVLSYDIPDALLDYTVSNKRLLVQESSDSDLTMSLMSLSTMRELMAVITLTLWWT